MAKLNLAGLMSLFGTNAPIKKEEIVDITSEKNMSSDEVKRLHELHAVRNKSRNDATVENTLSYLSPISENIAKNKIQSKELKALAPEINKAKTIVTASILSPNDMQEDSVSFTLDVDENMCSVPCQKVITDKLSAYFKDVLQIDVKLADWIDEITFGAGAVPVMIMPESMLRSMIETSYIPATESFDYNDLMNFWDNKIYSKHDEDFSFSFESLYSESDYNKVFDLIPVTENSKNTSRKDLEKSKVAFVKNTLNSIYSSDLISVHEDPRCAFLPVLEKLNNKSNIRSKIESILKTDESIRYREQKGYDLSKYSTDTSTLLDHPLFLTLPTESIIPMCVPGSPSDHIGYFCLLDDNGNPITNDSLMTTSDGKLSKLLNSNFQANFDTILCNNYKEEKIREKLYSELHEDILDRYLINAAQKMEYKSVSIVKNSEIYRNMLRRLLDNQKTKLLFIPAELLTYFCFEYNDDGTGRSKLADIVWPLTMKTTLITSRMMASIEEALNKDKITINFDKKVSDEQSVLNSLRDMLLSNKSVKWTYDPVATADNIIKRSVSVVPRNIPGLEGFEVEHEKMNSSIPKPDSDLLDEINNLLTKSLIVPPSALNELNETEYSRTVASNNLFFSKEILGMQKKVCALMDKLLRTYCTYSKPIRDMIEQTLKDSIDPKEEVGDADGVVDEDGNENDVLIKINSIINNINTRLPKPNIAPMKAQYETFQSHVEMLESIINKVYPSEFSEEDRDMQEILSIQKANLMTDFIKPMLLESGFSKYISLEALGEIDQAGILKQKRELANLNAGIKGQKELVDGE